MTNKDEGEALCQFAEALQQELDRLLQGEIEAQMWVWLSEDQSLVLDSLEAHRNRDPRFYRPILAKAAEKILNDHDNISRVLVGGQGAVSSDDPKEWFKPTADLAVPKDYSRYRDSDHIQYEIQCRADLLSAAHPTGPPDVSASTVMRTTGEEREPESELSPPGFLSPLAP